MLASKTELCGILGIPDCRALNKLIAGGVIPGPLPGTRLLHVPSVLAALEKAGASKTSATTRKSGRS
jgi:hypothetical protein